MKIYKIFYGDAAAEKIRGIDYRVDPNHYDRIE